MRDWIERGDPVSVGTVLRGWIDRESRKEEYPDADPTDWERERLLRELTDTYEEPAEPVVNDALDWYALELDGEELGELGTFPEPAWDRLSGDRTVAGAVERLDDPAVVDDFPGAAAKVDWFADHVAGSFGAAVAWQRDEEWPPRLLDGNHRACGFHRAAREGRAVSLTVHLGVASPP